MTAKLKTTQAQFMGIASALVQQMDDSGKFKGCEFEIDPKMRSVRFNLTRTVMYYPTSSIWQIQSQKFEGDMARFIQWMDLFYNEQVIDTTVEVRTMMTRREKEAVQRGKL